MAARDGLIQSAIDLMRRNGIAGTGVTQLVEHSGRSRRAIYLNFPGGKSELVAEATRVAGRAMEGLIATFTGNPRDALLAFGESWRHVLQSSDFAAGCPIVAAALGRSESAAAADAASEAFDRWATLLAERLDAEHVPSGTAKSLATTIVAAIEGAVVLSVAAQSTAPLDSTIKHMTELVELHTAQR
ncbi:TetR/AcrR family transcriptional regulator [Antrihabitans sp. YC2-6]|uniref:TetR/AcrR family transcriptional regulator n=1 Tax=Antrihabitans sp. YC2-6 TaxID=2799498 RepID=UPI0018F5BB84|nr:TetR family transcriptional regulator [Antrihabitans sp. YC2-6]MBJ8345460.1 TetR/AcrR family transcriptional regulator [Antrihabitans sp. YC2-6]